VSSQTDRVRRAVELCVYAPIGVAVWLRDLAPTFVNMFVARGKAEVERREEQVQQRIRTARGAGETTLAFGGPGSRDRIVSDPAEEAAATPAPPAAPAAGAPAAPAASARPAEPTVAAAPPTAASAHAASNGAATLAIPGYDALSASQVVERLAGLEHDELAAVRGYEAEHRNRRTILGKIDQLASSGSSTPMETSSGSSTPGDAPAGALDTSASA
jgi:hypothetical protein